MGVKGWLKRRKNPPQPTRDEAWENYALYVRSLKAAHDRTTERAPGRHRRDASTDAAPGASTEQRSAQSTEKLAK